MEYITTVYQTDKFIVKMREPVRTEAEKAARRERFAEDCRAYCREIERQRPGYFEKKREARAG